MIIVMKPHASEKSIENVVKMIQDSGLSAHLSKGEEVTIIGIVGDKSKISNRNLEIAPEVDKLVQVTESYKLTNKKFHPTPSVVKVGNTEIGPDTLSIMAGPCAIESEEQLLTIAHAVRRPALQFCGAARTSPAPPPIPSRVLRRKDCAT